MVVCDAVATLTTVVVLILFTSDMLQVWYLYLINAINGLMNTVQQPVSEIATTRILPKEYYQKVGGMRYFASSLNTILTPIIATAILDIVGLEAIISFDIFTAIVAILTLAFEDTEKSC